MRRRGSARIPELSAARNVIKRFWKHFQTDTFHACNPDAGCHDHRMECTVRKICNGYAGVTKFEILQDLLEFILIDRIFALISVGADDKGIYKRSELFGNEVWEGSVNTVSVSESQQQQIFCDLQHSLMRIATECPDLIYLAKIQKSKPLETEQEFQLWRFYTDISKTTTKIQTFKCNLRFKAAWEQYLNASASLNVIFH